MNENKQTLENIYKNFAAKNYDAVLASCADNVTFQIAGKSKLAGKYTKANFISDFATKLSELSGGTYTLEIHDIMSSDRHGIALATSTVTRAGKQEQLRTVHVWRIENGKPVAWYEYPRDLYQYDALWS